MSKKPEWIKKHKGDMKYGKPGWVRKYFGPEWLTEDGELITLKTGKGQISRENHTSDCQPWRYAPNDVGDIDMLGFRRGFDPSYGSGEKRNPRIWLTEEEFQEYCDTLNYFRNGGNTIKGNPGLDPRELIGAIRETPAGRNSESEPYVCKNGRYWTRPVQQFKFNDGTWWVSED